MVAISHPDAPAAPSPQRLGLVAFGTVAVLFALLFAFGSPEPATLEGTPQLGGSPTDPSGSEWNQAAP